MALTAVRAPRARSTTIPILWAFAREPTGGVKAPKPPLPFPLMPHHPSLEPKNDRANEAETTPGLPAESAGHGRHRSGDLAVEPRTA